jgi:hypothetical protein
MAYEYFYKKRKQQKTRKIGQKIIKDFINQSFANIKIICNYVNSTKSFITQEVKKIKKKKT